MQLINTRILLVELCLGLGCQGVTVMVLRLRLKHNGPAVEGVNVGGAVRRYESRYFSRKTVSAGKPPWRNFCQSRRTDKVVSVAGFVQSRSNGFGR